MRKLLIALAMVFSVPAMAQTAEPIIDQNSINCKSLDISKYTPEQLAKVQQVCAPTTQAIAEEITPDDVREWASLGKEFGVAVTETAKGLGVAVNDFVTTPVGIMIAFYFLWGKIGGIIVGIPLLIALWMLYFKIVNVYRYRDAEYENVPVLFGLTTRRKLVKENVTKPDDLVNAMCLIAIPAIFFSALILNVLIF